MEENLSDLDLSKIIFCVALEVLNIEIKEEK